MKITDTQRIDYLERSNQKDMNETSQCEEFLVLAMDGTTCWGKTFRDAVDEAIRHDTVNGNYLT